MIKNNHSAGTIIVGTLLLYKSLLENLLLIIK
jgi:hypothetical protein